MEDNRGVEETEEQGGGGVTADTYGALDTHNVNDECWMIRIPTKLSELWENAEEGTELGELVFTKGGTDGKTTVKPSLEVHVSEILARQEVSDKKKNKKPAAATTAGTTTTTTIPLNYSMQAMTKKIPVMHPFIRNPNNGSCTLLGMVSRTANLQVEKDRNYRALLKDRLVATNINTSRYVKPVLGTESVLTQQRATATTTASVTGAKNNANAKSSSNQNSKKRTFGNAVLQFGKRMLEAQQESSISQQQQQGGAGGGPAAQQKRPRQFAPDQPLRSVLFELFGIQQYWTVKDLKAAAVAGGCSAAGAKRADNEIKDILRKIAEYHRSGDHKSKWELRKEFQQQQQQQHEHQNIHK